VRRGEEQKSRRGEEQKSRRAEVERLRSWEGDMSVSLFIKRLRKRFYFILSF
jgi:hypothetical protein